MPRYDLANKRIGADHIGSLARPTPGFKLPPLGPRPNSSPHGVVAWAFSANPCPIPHSLRLVVFVRQNCCFFILYIVFCITHNKYIF
ncbi:hypothetical protein Hanom_Chr10g00905721 [Helianthus anomalus]